MGSSFDKINVLVGNVSLQITKGASIQESQEAILKLMNCVFYFEGVDLSSEEDERGVHICYERFELS